MLRVLLGVFCVVVLSGCASIPPSAPVLAMPQDACTPGWSLWKQTLANRQLGHVRVQNYGDQHACLNALKNQVAEGQDTWPMIYLVINSAVPGWLGCFPTVGYEPEKYK